MSKVTWFESPVERASSKAAVRIAREIKSRGSIAKFAREANVDPGTARDWIRHPERMRLQGAIGMLIAAEVSKRDIVDLLMRR